MSEFVKIDGDFMQSSYGHFLMTALGKMPKGGMEIINKPGSLEIEFKLNGVEIPFKDTLEELSKRWEASFQAEAAKHAYKILSLNGLEDVLITIRDAMRTVDWEIRKKIEAAFNVELAGD